VNWPTASVILHFVYPKRYPILDYRALWQFSKERARRILRQIGVGRMVG
jgi:hypothetical protein